MVNYETKVEISRITGCRNPPRPAYTEIFDGKGQNPYRYMCVVRFPWLNRSKKQIEWGLNCTGCRDKFHDQTHGMLDWRWLYTTAGYVEHAGQCSKSIEMLRSIV